MLRPPITRLVALAAATAAWALPVLASADKPILGYLGQASQKTHIFAAPNSHSRIYSRVKAQQYLVIRASEKPGWDQVLLQNGIYGFVPSNGIKQLPYEVSPRSSRTGSAASRGMAFARGDDEANRAGMADYALKFTGTPYRWGGTSETSGIDCSGFVQKMYGAIGLQLPRTAAEQAMVGQPIYRLEDLRKGDRLYFWEQKRGKIGHTGIYLGDGTFVHSSHGRGGVETSYLSSSWRQILVAARR